MYQMYDPSVRNYSSTFKGVTNGSPYTTKGPPDRTPLEGPGSRSHAWLIPFESSGVELGPARWRCPATSPVGAPNTTPSNFWDFFGVNAFH